MKYTAAISAATLFSAGIANAQFLVTKGWVASTCSGEPDSIIVVDMGKTCTSPFSTCTSQKSGGNITVSLLTSCESSPTPKVAGQFVKMENEQTTMYSVAGKCVKLNQTYSMIYTCDATSITAKACKDAQCGSCEMTQTMKFTELPGGMKGSCIQPSAAPAQKFASTGIVMAIVLAISGLMA